MSTVFKCYDQPIRGSGQEGTGSDRTDSEYLVERSNPLGELGLDLRQSLCPLQGLLQLLLGFIQTLLQLSVLLFTLETHTKTHMYSLCE